MKCKYEKNNEELKELCNIKSKLEKEVENKFNNNMYKLSEKEKLISELKQNYQKVNEELNTLKRHQKFLSICGLKYNQINWKVNVSFILNTVQLHEENTNVDLVAQERVSDQYLIDKILTQNILNQN